MVQAVPPRPVGCQPGACQAPFCGGHASRTLVPRLAGAGGRSHVLIVGR